MRIVLGTETFLPHVDGIVTRLTRTITHLVEAGDEVLIIAPRRPDSPAEFQGCRVLTVPSATLPLYPDVRLGFPVLPPHIERAITLFNPDLIHVVGPAFLGLGPAISALRRRLPLVASYHVQYPNYVRHYRLGALVPAIWTYLRLVHNRAQLNLATSLPMVRDLRSHGFKHLKHWRAGVDAARFNPAQRSDDWRRRLSDGHPDEILMICVSRLAIEKAIEKLAPVLRAVPGVRLALVGDGPAHERLQAVFAGLPVQFAGMLHGDDLDRAYASADLFALPSSTETLGLVALEAMASGLPTVVADRGGLPDLVIDGETGYLFDPDRPDDLIGRVLALVNDGELRRQMSLTARRHAERFTWSQTTRQLRAYYQHVLKRWPKPAADDFVPEGEPESSAAQRDPSPPPQMFAS